jgi:hypothetical protein
MKLVSIVGLGVFGIVSAGGSMAGELPAGTARPAPEARTARCDSNAGFAALVGTDTCVKIGGRVRADYLTSTFKLKPVVVPGPSFGQGNAVLMRPPRGFGTAADVAVDARTPTDFGTVRTYVRMRAVNGLGRGFPPEQ